MKNLKKLTRKELKVFQGGTRYACFCGNGKTVTIVSDSLQGAIDSISNECGNSNGSCATVPNTDIN